MLLAEYDYDTDIAVQRKEAFEDGISIGRNEGITIGITQGAQQAKIETAKSMKLENMPISMIARFTGLSVEEIEKLQILENYKKGDKLEMIISNLSPLSFDTDLLQLQLK